MLVDGGVAVGEVAAHAECLPGLDECRCYFCDSVIAEFYKCWSFHLCAFNIFHFFYESFCG